MESWSIHMESSKQFFLKHFCGQLTQVILLICYLFYMFVTLRGSSGPFLAIPKALTEDHFVVTGCS